MNYITIGTVSVRISSKGLAPWGFPWLQVAGLAFLTFSTNGCLCLASYHPRRSTCWHWAISVARADWLPGSLRFERDPLRRCQWHDYLHVTRRWAIVIARQDFHRSRGHERHCQRIAQRGGQEPWA